MRRCAGEAPCAKRVALTCWTYSTMVHTTDCWSSLLRLMWHCPPRHCCSGCTRLPATRQRALGRNIPRAVNMVGHDAKSGMMRVLCHASGCAASDGQYSCSALSVHTPRADRCSALTVSSTARTRSEARQLEDSDPCLNLRHSAKLSRRSGFESASEASSHR
jgi:hypothetical protein